MAAEILVWYKLFFFPGEEEIPTDVGAVRMKGDLAAVELRNKIYELHSRALGDVGPTDLVLVPFGTALPIDDKSAKVDKSTLVSNFPSTAEDTPLLVLVAESASNLSKRKLESLLETTQIALSDSDASEKLKTVKHVKCCFLCTTNAKVEASHIVQKSDISFKTQSSKSDAVRTLELITNWNKDPKWKRPFEIHGSMNLVWLCHTHNLAFDRHEFCLKIDISGRVLFHAFEKKS